MAILAARAIPIIASTINKNKTSPIIRLFLLMLYNQNHLPLNEIVRYLFYVEEKTEVLTYQELIK
jgi:hypothetical protein